MKRHFIRIAVFVVVLVATRVLQLSLESWLIITFELDDAGWFSMDSQFLLSIASAAAVSFFFGGAVLGLVAGTRRTAMLWGLLLGGVLVAIELISNFDNLGVGEPVLFWQVILFWANLWAPIPAAVGGAVVANLLLDRARSGHAT